MKKLSLDPLVIDQIDPMLRDSVQLNLQKIQDYINILINGLNPTGALIGLESATVPPGYLLADGSAFSGTSYPDLKTYLGGTTLPDYRGKFLVGRDGTTEFLTLGQTGGAKTVTIGSANLPLHTHGLNGHSHGAATGFTAPTHTHGLATGSTGGQIGNHTHNAVNFFGTSNTAHTHYAGGAAGEGSGAPQGTGRAGSTWAPSTDGVSADHTHNLSGSTDSGSSLNHAHTVAADNGSTTDGGFAGTALNKLPPYRVLNWYIKT